ncbi:MAG: T9SS type A sorting domain-containing protein [Candidatus Latescibacteria bacterium]|nr:T9SS type A sorting domain-containing protein [Candidatus Latescibacterota bacterium]
MLQIVLVLFTALVSPMTTPQEITKGGGGPDAYGYRYIDNDTVAPHAPVYNWKDISTAGTRIIGLMDDNVIGPFPIGFSFPYYWYRVNSFYVSSNGYISFSDNFNGASPFSNVPNPARPNDVVAPLMSDLDFSAAPGGDSAKCFYWTNATLDTCIISYINVRWWNVTTSRCTFQIILAKPDSSITFQYKRIVGAPFQGWSPTNNTTGIENVLGTVGLSYLNGLLPSHNVLHETLAVKFYPPQTTSYQVTDIGISNAMNENSGGFFIINNTQKPLWAKVRNSGNQPLSNCSAFVRIRNSANAIVHSSAVAIGSMTPSQVESITFTPWTPTTAGVYRTTFRAKVTGDMYVANDSVIIETRVITYPGELMYDNNVVDQGTYWQGNNAGMGVKFTPPQYPCRITAAKAYLYYQAAPHTCTLWVLKGDGPGGTPGTVLGRGNITVSATSAAPEWYQINLSPAPEISSGSFFVGVTSNAPSDPVYCIDTSFPISRQAWEYTGSWAPYRSNDVNEVMMRALVQLGTDIEELGPNSYVGTKPSLSVFPNPFANQTKIQFNGSVSRFKIVEIYNTAGERVTKLTTDNDFITWNGNDYRGNKLSRGIYFAKLKNEDAPVVKVLLLN